jgi:radical SAM superfamily enzyme YgiQ (UPF0313 family)
LKEGRLRLLLIQPSQIIDGGKVYKSKKIMFPRLSLPVLASLCPPETEIKIIDEYFEEINFGEPVDLVGISFMTSQAPRAYQIGDEFKKRGKGVVMGGIHASALPEEALIHADAVVVGEAEGIWPTVLEDFRKGMMEGVYRSPQFPSLNGLPIPRYDLLQKDRYRLLKINFPIQASRGCPFHCEFCSVSRFWGNQFRFRPVEEVVREIQKTSLKKIFFIDDNITGHRAYARELFRALIPLKIRWVGQAPLSLAKDEELLNLAAESGCAVLFMGIESLSESNLASIGKGLFKAHEIPQLFRRFREKGIQIHASIIFGLDDDGPDVFHKTVEFLIREKVAYSEFFLLTPLPGTSLRERLEEEDRILDYDWSHYDCFHVVFQPLRMDRESLEKGLWDAYRRFYSTRSIFQRLSGNAWGRRSLRTMRSNFYYQRLVRKGRYPFLGE